jgi:hypothetical protein
LGAGGDIVTDGKSRDNEAPEICPYWHEVAADFASVYPGGGYCIAGCHKKVKVMAGKTVRDLCLLNYAGCEGYQRVMTEEEVKTRERPETFRR